MPQVQVLPHVPGFGESLVNTLIQAGGAIGEGLKARASRNALAEIANRFQKGQSSSTPASPVQQMQAEANQASTPVSLSPLDIAEIGKYAERAYGPEGGKAFTNALLQQQKLQEKEAADVRKEERALGRIGQEDFFKKIENDRVKLPEEELANEMIMDAIKNGDIDPFSSAHIADIAKSFGAPDSLVKILETPGSKEFKTAKKTFISTILRDTFKGTTTKAEINLAEDMIAEVGVSKEGNLASAWGMQVAVDLRKERIRLTDELKEKGVTPSKIPALVDKMMIPYTRELKDEYFEALRSLRKGENGK